MVQEALEKGEKKVEYVELIYDLIFVYVIGCNNALMDNVQDGFVTIPSLVAYVLCTFAVIQIWNFSTYYINMYGRNSARNYVFLFTNMFLLYFMGTGARTDWLAYEGMYHVAWALILINTCVQYGRELWLRRHDPRRASSLRKIMLILIGESTLVLLAIPLQETLGMAFSIVAVLFGIVATLVAGLDHHAAVDFGHLSERAMLYVVFTFGEMVVAIASYFDGGLGPRSIYFALMAFLIVVGLFLSYGTFYDHLVDREAKTNGLTYMFMHVMMIFGLNNVSIALGFMHDGEVALVPKMVFLVGSFILYYAFLFAARRYAKKAYRSDRRHGASLIALMVVLAASFVVVMALLRNNMALNIAVTVVYVFIIWLQLYVYARRIERSL